MKSIHALSGAGILLCASGLLFGQTVEPQVVEPYLVEPYGGSPALAPPIAPLPLALPPIGPEGPQQLPVDDPMVFATGEDLLSEVDSDCPSVQVYSSRIAIDFTFADFELDDGTAQYRTTEPTSVLRTEVAIDIQDGYGVRSVIWSLDKEFKTQDDERLETRIASFYVDGYRRFVSEDGELLLGGGLAIGSLKTESPFDESVHRFNGIGASVAGEGFYPFMRFEKTDIGVTGRARLAVLGPVEDNFDDSGAMLVDELGVGIELRRRFGKQEDKMWFVRLGREWQHWSDVDSPFAGDQRVEGTSFLVGFAW